MPRAAAVCTLLVALASSGFQESKRPSLELPTPTDVDPQLTEQLRQVEKQLCDAILQRDAEVLDRLLAPEYTLRIADIPQSSLPRAIWMDNTLKRLKAQSCEQNHAAARKIADDLAAVSVVWSTKATTDGRDFSGDFYIVDFWKKGTGTWQIIARYSTPLGNPPDRGPLQPPPAKDISPNLTEQLRHLEQQVGEAAMHMDTKALERLVEAEYTLRIGDAPEQSVPRAVWMESLLPQAPRPYKLESFNEQYHAARKLTENLAVVSLLLTQKATVAGRDRSGDFYIVDIWKKSSDQWQMIARYSTPIGKNFDRSPAQ